jgi:hypothetical protein
MKRKRVVSGRVGGIWGEGNSENVIFFGLPGLVGKREPRMNTDEHG